MSPGRGRGGGKPKPKRKGDHNDRRSGKKFVKKVRPELATGGSPPRGESPYSHQKQKHRKVDGDIVTELNGHLARELRKALADLATTRPIQNCGDQKGGQPNNTIKLILVIDLVEPSLHIYPQDDDGGHRITGYCFGCGRFLKLTKHHVYPRRWAKEGWLEGPNPHHFWFCRECHDKLEIVIKNVEERFGCYGGAGELVSPLEINGYLSIIAGFIADQRRLREGG